MRIAILAAVVSFLTLPVRAYACGGGGSGYSGGGGSSGPDLYSECIRWQPEDAGDSGPATDGGNDAGQVCAENATYAVALGCSSATDAAAPLALLFALLAFRPRTRARAVRAS